MANDTEARSYPANPALFVVSQEISDSAEMRGGRRSRIEPVSRGVEFPLTGKLTGNFQIQALCGDFSV